MPHRLFGDSEHESLGNGMYFTISKGVQFFDCNRQPVSDLKVLTMICTG